MHSIHLDLIYLDGRYRDISPQRIAVDKARSVRGSVMVDEYTSNCPRDTLPLPTSRSLTSTKLRRRRIPLIPVIMDEKCGICSELDRVEFLLFEYRAARVLLYVCNLMALRERPQNSACWF